MNRAQFYGFFPEAKKEEVKPKSADFLRPLTLVSESPDKDGNALYATRTGRRLLDMYPKQLPTWTIHGAPPSRWSVRVARARVEWWLSTRPGTTEPLFLMGRKVCQAFGIEDAVWLDWYRGGGHRHPMIAFPHPSSRNRWWDDAENVERARVLLVDVAELRLPHVESLKRD